MTGEPLLWLQSYMNLSDLMQYVSINGGTSVKHPLRCVSLRCGVLFKKTDLNNLLLLLLD